MFAANVKMSVCVMLQAMVVDLIVAADGHNYERKAIEAWLQQSSVSPVSGARLIFKRVASNHIVDCVVAMHWLLQLAAMKDRCQ